MRIPWAVLLAIAVVALGIHLSLRPPEPRDGGEAPPLPRPAELGHVERPFDLPRPPAPPAQPSREVASRPAPYSVAALTQRLGNGDEGERVRSAYLLAILGHGSDEVVRALIAGLDVPENRFSFRSPTKRDSVWALGMLGSAARAAAPHVERSLHGASFYYRIAGAHALWKITESPERAIEELSDVVNHCPRITVQIAAWQWRGWARRRWTAPPLSSSD